MLTLIRIAALLSALVTTFLLLYVFAYLADKFLWVHSSSGLPRHEVEQGPGGGL